MTHFPTDVTVRMLAMQENVQEEFQDLKENLREA